MPAALAQFDEPIEDAPGIGPAIDVIAQRDEKVVRLRLDDIQEGIERRQTAVDIADGKGAHIRFVPQS